MSGKVLLVTGGSRGIGAETARLAAARGWRVAVNYVSDKSAADAVVADIEAAGGVMDQLQFGHGAVIADRLAAQPCLAGKGQAAAQLRGRGTGKHRAQEKASRDPPPPAGIGRRLRILLCPAPWRAHRSSLLPIGRTWIVPALVPDYAPAPDRSRR